MKATAAQQARYLKLRIRKLQGFIRAHTTEIARVTKTLLKLKGIKNEKL